MKLEQYSDIRHQGAIMETDLIDTDRHGLPQGSTVYKLILGRLRRGEISPGDRLVDVGIAAELGVSRMPVREALLRLVHEGYLVGSTRGFRLPRMSADDIREIFELRKLLEPRAAASAAQGVDSAGLERMEAAWNDARRAVEEDNHTELMEAYSRFRSQWLGAVPNRRLADTISRFVDHVQTVRILTLAEPETQRIALSLLTELLEGFRSRDALRVYDSMIRFVDRAEERFLLRVAADPNQIFGSE